VPAGSRITRLAAIEGTTGRPSLNGSRSSALASGGSIGRSSDPQRSAVRDEQLSALPSGTPDEYGKVFVRTT